MHRRHKRRTRKNARRAMKRIGNKESRFRHHHNHVISKTLVIHAKDTGRGIALENLKGIRDRTRFRREQRSKMGGWAFAQLRQFITYKGKLYGVPVVVVDPPAAPAPAVAIARKPIARARPNFAVCVAGSPAMPTPMRQLTLPLAPPVNRR